MSEKLIELFRDKKPILGYIQYVSDIEKWTFKMIPLYKLHTVVRLKEYNESYHLGDSYAIFNGKPVYLILKDVPYSLKIELVKEKLIIKGYSASEIDAKINSIYTNNVFRRASYNAKDFIITLTLCIICVLVTCLVMYIWHTNEIARITTELTMTNNDDAVVTILRGLFSI